MEDFSASFSWSIYNLVCLSLNFKQSVHLKDFGILSDVKQQLGYRRLCCQCRVLCHWAWFWKCRSIALPYVHRCTSRCASIHSRICHKWNNDRRVVGPTPITKECSTFSFLLRSLRTSSISSRQPSCMVWKDSCGARVNSDCLIRSSCSRISGKRGRSRGFECQHAGGKNKL